MINWYNVRTSFYMEIVVFIICYSNKECNTFERVWQTISSSEEKIHPSTEILNLNVNLNSGRDLQWQYIYKQMIKKTCTDSHPLKNTTKHGQ
jgi:hypothetical protein